MTAEYKRDFRAEPLKIRDRLLEALKPWEHRDVSATDILTDISPIIADAMGDNAWATEVEAAREAELRMGEAVVKLQAENERLRAELYDGSGDGYDSLRDILVEAVAQASTGKGRERHSSGEPFEGQPIIKICEWLGSNHFALGQAIKKLRESVRLPSEKAERDLLGAIVYTAAAIIAARRISLREDKK